MNPDVIQFQCNACRATLTVPAHMAGVSGPCPTCGQTVTSPAAAPAPAPTPAPSFGGFPAAPAAPHFPPMPTAQPLPNQAGMLGGRPAGPGPGILGGSMPAQAPVMPPPQMGQYLPQAPNPAAAFPSARPANEAPPWQQPGLGQALLGPSPAVPGQPAAPAGGNSFLPPRRPDGQPPQAGSVTGAASAPWGAGGAAAPQPAMAGTHPGGQPAGGFMGGAPMSPLMGTPAARDPRAQWAGREAPAAGAPQGFAPGPNDVTLPPQQHPQQTDRQRGGDRRQRPAFPQSRGGGKRAPTGLLLLLAATVVGAGAWMFREPIREAVQGTKTEPESSAVAEEHIPQAPPQSPPAPEPSTVASTPPAPEPPSPGRFDPNESSGAKTEPPDGEEVAAATKTAPSGLMEVPSKSVEAGIKSSENEPPALAVKTEVRLEGVTAEARPAVDAAVKALQKFLSASTVEERMRYTLAPEMMRDYMQRYYSANPMGPINVDTIGFVRLDPKPQMGNGAHAVFGLESRAWRYPVLVMMEEGKDGFRVDWLSFVEFKDRILERFFKEYSEGPARFHVGLTRTHYFGDGVPNADKKYAFNISSAPPNPFSATVFVDMESALGKELKDKIPWGAQVWAIAELEWMRLGNHQWVELAAVPQLNWYSVPTNASSGTSQPMRSPSSPTEIQRAVPIGR